MTDFKHGVWCYDMSLAPRDYSSVYLYEREHANQNGGNGVFEGFWDDLHGRWVDSRWNDERNPEAFLLLNPPEDL